MKRKLLMGIGAALLISVGVFAGNAIKFAAASDIWVKKSSTSCVRLAAVANPVNTKLNDVSSGGGSIATMTDESGVAFELYENSNCTTALYFNP